MLECYTSFESLALKNGLSLATFDSPEIEYYGDESRIKQLTIILLDNVVKNTPSGGQVSLSLKRDDYHIRIIVSDTGEGIDKEDLDKIFYRFYRADKARSRKEGSTGLGLSIAQWIVEEHNGKIDVSSTKGLGSTFIVTLPYKKQ